MRYVLSVTAFIEGAVVMILELTGSRVVAPYLGTSIIVWTSLIGVILASLSVGYYLGGRWADKNPDVIKLSRLLLIASLLIALIVFFKPVLAFVSPSSFGELMLFAVMLTLLLFAPPTIILGMVTPYIAKLLITDTSTSGRTVGTLYAVSTLGSIVGTFLGGFFLISFFGSTKILIILALTLLVVSAVVYFSARKTIGRMTMGLSLAFILFTSFFAHPLLFQGGALVADIDTQYGRLWIYDSVDPMTRKPVRYMTDSIQGIQSGIFKEDPDTLLFEYSKLFDMAGYFRPDFTATLMIGAGMYSYPKHFVKKFPQATIDVAEIDPKLKIIAGEYFGLKSHPAITIFDEDGRNYLNRTTNSYDVIFIDAFRSEYSVPFQLTTKEAVTKVHNALDEKGIVILNIISAVEGFRGAFLHAMVATYQSVFEDVRVFKVHPQAPNDQTQNVIVVAFKEKQPEKFSTLDPVLQSYLRRMIRFKPSEDALILTDDFAPVEKLIARLLI